MKLLTLELTAFGLFTNATLDFTAPAQGLHLIYGANEAGKSTTRRAINHFLFGIPERTNDAFLHNNDQLRIGARLSKENGQIIEAFRRKGRKNTLINTRHNTPLDETEFHSFLSTITESRFSTLFCFDHEQLRQGGDALLNSGGEVGESLFSAGTGNAQLHKLLSELDKEATDLFNPRARSDKPKLNQSIRIYKEASKRIKDCSLSPNRWIEQARALDAAREQHQHVTQQLRQLQKEQQHLTRIQRTLPLLKRQKILKDTLTQLAHVILIPADSQARRLQILANLNTAQAQEQQAHCNIQELQQTLAQLFIPQLLLAEKNTLHNLVERSGSHQKAARDLPGVRTEMRTVQNDAEVQLRLIYPQFNLTEVSQLQLTQLQRNQLERLANEQPVLLEKQVNLQERLNKINQQLKQQQDVLAQLPTIPPLDALKAALTHALKQGDLEQQMNKAEKTVKLLKQETDIALKQLGLWTGTLDELDQLALPAAERIEQFDQRFKELETDQRRIKERLLEARRRAAEAEQKLEALNYAGAVPTEDDLHHARTLRNQQWQGIKQGTNTPELQQQFEAALLQADEIADRLRREAHRVAEYANLLAERHSTQQEHEQHIKKWYAANDLLHQTQRDWLTCWEAVDILPGSPAEMRAWLTRCLHLRQLSTQLREQQHIFTIQQQLMQKTCGELTHVLGHLPHRVIPLTRLSDLVEQARSSVDYYATLQRQHDDTHRQINNLHNEQQNLETACQQIGEALNDWQRQWTQALIPLHLASNTDVAGVRSVLNILDQVMHKIERIHGLRRRIERMEEDANVFRADVVRLTAQLAPELLDLPVENIVVHLSERLSAAERDATRQEQLQQRLEKEQRTFTQAQTQLQQAQAQLQVLFQQACCDNVNDLELAEQKSAHKYQVQKELLELEQQLLEQGEGLSLLELAQAANEIDPDQLPDQIQQNQNTLQQLEQTRSELDQKIGELKTLLGQMDGNAEAAKAADEAQFAKSEIQTLSERYIQTHLAAFVLRKSMDRYREQHQEPLLQRTSALFSRLTLGRYQGVCSGFVGNNPQAVLLGMRDRAEIATHAMSEGTRDQLYLALRLASVSHYLAEHEPLPLVLDDILINFDDDRAAVTLQILAEFAQQTQVLFFTHHQHLISLAQSVVKSDLLKVHALG
jgi:uncharacterized protein YhaN